MIDKVAEAKIRKLTKNQARALEAILFNDDGTPRKDGTPVSGNEIRRALLTRWKTQT